jgi:hypothetical protein
MKTSDDGKSWSFWSLLYAWVLRWRFRVLMAIKFAGTLLESADVLGCTMVRGHS